MTDSPVEEFLKEIAQAAPHYVSGYFRDKAKEVLEAYPAQRDAAVLGSRYDSVSFQNSVKRVYQAGCLEFMFERRNHIGDEPLNPESSNYYKVAGAIHDTWPEIIEPMIKAANETVNLTPSTT